MLELIDPMEKYDDYCRQKIIEELERISYKMRCAFWNNAVDRIFAEKILDERIKELKGNKE